MPPKTLPPQPASPAKDDSKDLPLAADYLRWISFEGCCSPATDPESKLPDEPKAERERALKVPLKTLQGGE